MRLLRTPCCTGRRGMRTYMTSKNTLKMWPTLWTPKPRVDLRQGPGPDSFEVCILLNCVAADEWVVSTGLSIILSLLIKPRSGPAWLAAAFWPRGHGCYCRAARSRACANTSWRGTGASCTSPPPPRRTRSYEKVVGIFLLLHKFSSFPKARVDLQVKLGKRGTELSRGKSPLCPRKELAYRNVAALKGRRLWV